MQSYCWKWDDPARWLNRNDWLRTSKINCSIGISRIVRHSTSTTITLTDDNFVETETSSVQKNVKFEGGAVVAEENIEDQNKERRMRTVATAPRFPSSPLYLASTTCINEPPHCFILPTTFSDEIFPNFQTLWDALKTSCYTFFGQRKHQKQGQAILIHVYGFHKLKSRFFTDKNLFEIFCVQFF